MSAENVQLIRELFSRFNPDDLDDWALLWHEDSVSTPVEGWPEQGPFEGRDTIRRQFERLFEDWSEYEFRDLEIVADPGDWVVATWTLRTRGAASGVETELDQATAFQVQDGSIRAGHFRWNAEQALEATQP